MMFIQEITSEALNHMQKICFGVDMDLMWLNSTTYFDTVVEYRRHFGTEKEIELTASE